MNELALFAGAGGGLLASRLLGWRTVCAVEIDAYARKSLFARQRDGMLERFPIWDDIKTFNGKRWRHSVDVVSGGFPCQDISQAGTGKGLAGNRSGLFFEMLRVVDEVRPRFVFAENSPNLRTKGLVTIVKEFDRLGYDTRWCVLGAWHAGAPHRRNRMWIVAHADSARQQRANKAQQKKRKRFEHCGQVSKFCRSSYWSFEPELGRMAHGVASRVDRLRCIGNGQVPAVATCAWRMLTCDLEVEQ